jgi:hypothetical protein
MITKQSAWIRKKGRFLLIFILGPIYELILMTSPLFVSLRKDNAWKCLQYACITHDID